MRTPLLWQVCLALVLAAAPARRAPARPPDTVAIWLVGPPGCNSCGIYDAVARQRGYGAVLHYAGRRQLLDIPIERVRKAEIPLAVTRQLTGDRGTDGPDWAEGLTVIVLRGSKVLFFGDFSESADLAQFHFSRARMSPPAHPAHPAPTDPAESDEDAEFARFFRAQCNLEYFVAVALGERSRQADAPFVDLDSPTVVPLAHTNVILWGAASTPQDNHVFTAKRLQEIRPILEALLPPSAAVKYLTLYGHGPHSDANDTSTMQGGVVSYERADLAEDFGADAGALGMLLTSVRRSTGTRTLIVHAGHSGPDGAPLWGSAGDLAPEDLADVGFSSRREVVMVSGGCNSGVFANAVSCGFFAAHPEVTATGCQLTPEAIEKSDDYLRLFFQGLTPGARDEADSDRDGKVSLAEAHWYASTRIEDHQISYTSIDAMADDYFESHPHRLPKAMTVQAIRALSERGTAAERAAALRMTAGKPAQLRVPLDDLVGRNEAALARLESADEMSSAQRNAILALPYKLELPLLARRLIYEGLRRPEMQPVAACEAQSVGDLQR